MYKVWLIRDEFSNYYPETTTANKICLGTFYDKQSAENFIENQVKYNTELRNRLFIEEPYIFMT